MKTEEMKDRKYEFTGEEIDFGLSRLKRIMAIRNFGDVKKGDIGGFIEKEENLSHDGNCWVFHNAFVRGKAKIYENAKIFDRSMVLGCANVYGNAKIFDDALIAANSHVFGNANISGKACIRGNAKVSVDISCGEFW